MSVMEDLMGEFTVVNFVIPPKPSGWCRTYMAKTCDAFYNAEK